MLHERKPVPDLCQNNAMNRKILQSLLLAVFLCVAAFPVQAQEKAVLPYSVVSKYLDLFRSLEHLDRIVPGMLVASTDPEVKPQNIQFRVKAEDGWQTFNPDENGNIDFPVQPGWDNLVLVSNQPRGTLQLGVGFSANPPDSTATTYRELMSLVPQFKEALSALAGLQGLPAPEVTGLTIQMPEGSGASVRVESRNGQRTLKSYATGIVVIKYDDALWQENPPVQFDELPIGIVPLK